MFTHLMPSEPILKLVGSLFFWVGGSALALVLLAVCVLAVYAASDFILTRTLKAFGIYSRVVKVSARMYEEDRRKKRGEVTPEEALREEYDRRYGYMLSQAERLVDAVVKEDRCLACGYALNDPEFKGSTTTVDHLRLSTHEFQCPAANTGYQIRVIQELNKRAEA